MKSEIEIIILFVVPIAFTLAMLPLRRFFSVTIKSILTLVILSFPVFQQGFDRNHQERETLFKGIPQLELVSCGFPFPRSFEIEGNTKGFTFGDKYLASISKDDGSMLIAGVTVHDPQTDGLELHQANFDTKIVTKWQFGGVPTSVCFLSRLKSSDQLFGSNLMLAFDRIDLSRQILFLQPDSSKWADSLEISDTSIIPETFLNGAQGTTIVRLGENNNFIVFVALVGLSVFLIYVIWCMKSRPQ